METLSPEHHLYNAYILLDNTATTRNTRPLEFPTESPLFTISIAFRRRHFSPFVLQYVPQARKSIFFPSCQHHRPVDTDLETKPKKWNQWFIWKTI